jgi:hypothetical protein
MPSPSQTLTTIISVNLADPSRSEVEPSKAVGFVPVMVGSSPDTMQPVGQTLVQGHRSQPAPKKAGGPGSKRG